jgi:hypothetical protein
LQLPDKKTTDVNKVNFQNFDKNLAKRIFHNMNYKSTYNKIYGDKPAIEDDFICLKQKKFSQVVYSQYFTRQAVQFIERWLEINDSEEFLKRVFIAIRDMYTVIKNLDIPVSTTNNTFLPKLKEASKPPRFDKIERAVKYADKLRSRSITPMKRLG